MFRLTAAARLGAPIQAFSKATRAGVQIQTSTARAFAASKAPPPPPRVTHSSTNYLSENELPADLARLLHRNKLWAYRMDMDLPGFFDSLKNIQKPHTLWLGCADSRVPSNQILRVKPGEVFVHRNVANLFDAEDPNASAVVDFGVSALKVSRVIVCGHYRCGGVEAALFKSLSDGRVKRWIEPIARLAEENKADLDAQPDDAARSRLLCELNVIAQARKVAAFDAVQAAGIPVLPVIYDVADGHLHPLRM